MSVVDTSTWKPFRVGDLFGAAKHGAYVNPRYLSSDADGFTIVSASTKNNGVSNDRYACDESSLIPSDVVTWGKQSPLFAYQTEATIPGQGVYYYDVATLSECQALFLCSVMQSAVASKYDYQECLIGNKMDDELILLPATPDGEPDWAYMETYMRQVLDREEMFAEHLASLTAEAVADGHVIDTSAWKAFKVGDLFDVLTTKSMDKLMLDIDDEKPYPYIGRTCQNNGVLGFVDKQSFCPNEAGVFSVVQIGDNVCFYQPTEWYATQNIFKLVSMSSVSLTAGLFVSSVITKQLSLMFGDNAYANYPTKTSLANMLVYFPATSDGAPDWAYMEQYMRDVMAIEALFADELDRVYCE